jgi:hypothetical protein
MYLYRIAFKKILFLFSLTLMIFLYFNLLDLNKKIHKVIVYIIPIIICFSIHCFFISDLEYIDNIYFIIITFLFIIMRYFFDNPLKVGDRVFMKNGLVGIIQEIREHTYIVRSGSMIMEVDKNSVTLNSPYSKWSDYDED